MSSKVLPAGDLGNFRQDKVINFKWGSVDSDGASITLSANGTISVYKDDNTTQTTDGVTFTEDFDSLTGIHNVGIDLDNAFYENETNYSVILSAATIDGETVNAVLASFSINNRAT